ncbi:MAG: alpha/beta fold hydrolase [Nitrospinae bacterium]|nr:alpha/beta fold hydrolase [Nitrospinota bacterium]
MFSEAIEILLLLPLAFVLIAYALSAWLSRFEPRRSARPGTMLFWLCKEYYWMIIYLFIATFVSPFDQMVRKKKWNFQVDEKGGPLIVILHGYLSVPTHWLPLQKKLKRRGFKNILRYSYHSLAGSIEAWSTELAKRMEPFHEHGIVFVGHSMGGVVAAWAASKMPKGSVKKIITMGSPFAGTLMADFALTFNARKLYPYTPEIEKTKKLLEELDPDIEFVCLWSRFDQLIVPPESAAPERARAVEMKGLGHTGYHFEADISRFI